jgi:hypothetical protein
MEITNGAAAAKHDWQLPIGREIGRKGDRPMATAFFLF